MHTHTCVNNYFVWNYLQTDGTSFMCTTCFSYLPDKKELHKHVCFDNETTDSHEDIIYCLSDVDTNEETFNESDQNSNNILDNHDGINIEHDINIEPYIPQLKSTTPYKKPKKDGKLFTFYSQY